MYYEINETTAKRAKEMMSFSDYVPNTATDRYKADVDKAYEIATEAKKDLSPELCAKVDYLADKYAKKLADYINKDNEIGCRCPAVMIAGPSNFPVRKKEKQVEAWNKLYSTYNDIKKILDDIQSIKYGKGIIKSNDKNAIELLQAKVDTLTAEQEKMKRYNAYYRKHKTMVGFPEISEDEALRIDRKIETAYSWCKQPFPSYYLTNNNACIKQAQSRLNDLTAKSKVAEEQEKPSETVYNGFRVVENLEMDRLQLLFDGKPEEKTRTLLKSNGFRWAPSVNAWQRQLTVNAKYALERVVSQI